MNNIASTMVVSTKNKIVKVLSEVPNISAKQIHHQLQKEFGISHSYQATHKTLQEMVVERILVKNNSFYQVNIDWADNFRKTAEQLAEKIKTKEPTMNLNDLKEGQSVHLSFKGILEVGWFLIGKFMRLPSNGKKSLALWRFCYSIIGLENKHLSGLKEAFSMSEWVILVEENNGVDRMFGDTLKSYGVKNITYGVKCATLLSDRMVVGDYTAEIIYPSTFRKIWAIQNKLPKKLVEFNLAEHLMAMREFQPKIDVIVTKDNKLADEFRAEYLG